MTNLIILIGAALCATALSDPVHPAGERRSLIGMISSSDLIVFAQAEDSTAKKRIKNNQTAHLTGIKVFQNIKGKSPSRYILFSGQGESPALYVRGDGAIIFLKKIPAGSPSYGVCPYMGVQTNDEKILLSGANDLAVIDAVRKITVALAISDPPVRGSTIKNLLLTLLTHPEERIRQDAVGDLNRIVDNIDGTQPLALPVSDHERLVRVASSEDIDPLTRRGTILLLGKMKDLDSLLSLTAASPESVRTTAIDMLGHCRDEKAVDPLMEIVRNGGGPEKKAALFALGRIGGTKALKFLKKLSRKGEGETRTWAREALAPSPAP